jgi:hypothetical protein
VLNVINLLRLINPRWITFINTIEGVSQLALNWRVQRHRGNHLFFDHRGVLVLITRCLRIVNFVELRKDEVRRIYLLDTRAELLGRCHTCRNPGTSLKWSIPEDPPTPPAMPSNHLQHTDARNEVPG